jgi:hypothetical protein
MPFFDLHNLQWVSFIVPLQHNVDYVSSTVFGGFLYYQPHIFHTAAVFCAGGNDINSCSVYTAVT